MTGAQGKGGATPPDPIGELVIGGIYVCVIRGAAFLAEITSFDPLSAKWLTYRWHSGPMAGAEFQCTRDAFARWATERAY